ncbi:hypothetical protein M2459_001340 [Parabacteroides sp. PF5-5]|uniref:hypothetical protein n=1 Tax=unclassified Parabacteroides TaxID=2649774 RepID=UPI002475EE7C|nr:MULTISPECIES: hypothetical protein [unclassified Parabacteroides]MDH6304605.1 hypothetical protein [Parabacteroides sp. PH5-39]MDH6315782.1 hypothetical protein [Parabacteroides sp. PF5-13]MDH6319441.1 hypothetical protein [Parabacteroides sp. PH5-13]MDH6323172.1 hypothetical protein [Parabacteroides sp. PH5-8]MDH6326974.1 hypothetical protein [Parabacteroides sp. PH5-41]
MKTKYNKSEIMKKAWAIHRSKWQYASNFSMCLKRAWDIAKESIEYEAKQAAAKEWENRPKVKVELTKEQKEACYQAKLAFMASLYSTGVYSGD